MVKLPPPFLLQSCAKAREQVSLSYDQDLHTLIAQARSLLWAHPVLKHIGNLAILIPSSQNSILRVLYRPKSSKPVSLPSASCLTLGSQLNTSSLKPKCNSKSMCPQQYSHLTTLNLFLPQFHHVRKWQVLSTSFSSQTLEASLALLSHPASNPTENLAPQHLKDALLPSV